MGFGEWSINVEVGKMPQQIATAVGKLNELVGAEYEPIAYLGSQVVNGTNHAVLAEQTIVAGKDQKNIVVLIYHETKEGVTLSSIERVVEGGAPLGGVQIEATTDIPADAKEAFDAAFSDRVGIDIKPFVYLGSQVTKGTDYIFGAVTAPIVPDAVAEADIVVVNGLTKRVAFINLLANKQELVCGYAFTWLK